MIVMSMVRGTTLAVVSVLALAGCQRSVSTTPQETALPPVHPAVQNPDLPPSLGAAQAKLEDEITQPSSSFRLTYIKTGPDGYSCSYDVEVSSKGIRGKESLVRSQSNGGSLSHARAQVRDLDGTPIGSNSWRFIANDLLTSFGSDLQYVESGLRYIDDESVGGFETRRYDFNLADVSTANKSVPVNADLISLTSSLQQPKYYSFKGSAWIAKNEGRLVKAQYDHITTFNNGTKAAIHYDLATTKE